MNTSSTPQPLLVTINTALSMIGLGRTKFYELVNGGRIETVVVGSRRLVKVSSLRRLAGEAV